MCSNGDNNKVISSYTYIYQTILTILPTCKPVRTSTDTRTDHGVNIWRAHAYACILQYYDVFDLVNVRLGAGGRWRTRDDDACLPVPRGANSSIHAYLSLPASLLHCMADGSRRRGQSTHATAPLRSFECIEWKTGLSIAAARASYLLPASLTLAGACIASNDGGKWSGGRWVGWGTFTRAGEEVNAVEG